LIASLIGFAISYAGLRVSEVSLLGSKLAITKFEVIPILLGIIVLYFLVTFIIFGFYDYAQSNRKIRIDYLDRISKGEEYSWPGIKSALGDLEAELEDIENEIERRSLEGPEVPHKLNRMKREKEQEIFKLKRISEFYEYNKASMFERFRLRGMRTFFDLFFPIIVGIFVAILLFFYTEIPEVEATTPKPAKEVTIGLRLSLDDANNVTSYSLIEKPASDEGD